MSYGIDIDLVVTDCTACRAYGLIGFGDPMKNKGINGIEDTIHEIAKLISANILTKIKFLILRI